VSRFADRILGRPRENPNAAMRSVAVIPVYRPDSSALLDLLDTLTTAGIPVLVTDDASPCTFDHVLRAVTDRGIPVVRHPRNAGIARGLNEGLAFAREQGASWLLTVDQDSSLPAGYVEALLTSAPTEPGLWSDPSALRPGVIGAGIIGDASGDLGYPTRSEQGFSVTEEVFQTGSLWSVAALTEVGGFDERLGIDGVDSGACLALRKAGYSVIVAPEVRLAHTLGTQARSVRILGREVVSTGHSPERRESMVRNRLRLAPGEFAESPTHAFRTLRRLAMNTALAVTVEDDRWAKAKGSVRGLFPRGSR
jgi:rhamnosyltransferase